MYYNIIERYESANLFRHGQFYYCNIMGWFDYVNDLPQIDTTKNVYITNSMLSRRASYTMTCQLLSEQIQSWKAIL